MKHEKSRHEEIHLGTHGEDYGSWMSNPVFYMIGGLLALSVVLAVLSFTVFRLPWLGAVFSVAAAAFLALLCWCGWIRKQYAFGGGGMMERTHQCLLAHLGFDGKGTLLDVGCGSGILSVAGLLLGAEKAVGVDIDALAVKTAGENAQTNGVEEKFQGICGNLTDQVAGKYELVVANIVADIIILLTKDITRYLNPDSIYLMSGIIDTRVQEVRDALEPRFTILEERQEKGWFALAAKQKS